MRSIALAIILLVFASLGVAGARAFHDGEKTSQGWALAQLRSGAIADFDKRCGNLDPRNKGGWDDPCRRIPAKFVIDVLTDPGLRAKLGQHGMRLRGAWIAGDIDLSDVAVTPVVAITASRIEGNLYLSDSHLQRPFSLDGSTLTGELFAAGMHSDSSLSLGNHAAFEGGIDLSNAKIGDDLYMSGSSFSRAVSADRVVVGGSAFIDRGAHFDDQLILKGGRIGGNLNMNFSSFAGPVQGKGLDVQGMAAVWNGQFFDAVDMRSTTFHHYLDLRGSTFTAIDFSDATAEAMLFENVRWWCAGAKPAPDAAVPSGTIAGPWPLGDPAWRNTKCNGVDLADPPPLILRNMHVEAFQDGIDAWPASVELEGFHYDRLGDSPVKNRQDEMRIRTPEQWIDLLARQRSFSAQPYTQLAKVLVAAGQEDTAEEIQFAGLERERRETLTNHPIHRAWLFFLSLVLGYGIAHYTYHVILSLVALTAIGTIVLLWSPPARRKGPHWMVCASLHRLLPIVELSKEFTEFFDNASVTQAGKARETRNLNGLQQTYFAVHALMGWALGLLLIAALSGLVQK